MIEGVPENNDETKEISPEEAAEILAKVEEHHKKQPEDSDRIPGIREAA